ncbi:TonB-dependent receptor [Carboxylicivirga sediminis]|uniref:TonB-dependent receptor n=1 Tax=Carboxylicivirga sediminis TaxID=2006564 RepID=A0A941F116_9BACT|nr:TonB-dependent receptor [Carboxylicivirga sediminis]MBR8534472.1 TonB-dependent receptor [Carboxylicivirga sediminis]
MTRRLFLLMFVCLQFFIAGAQNIRIQGKVLDENGEPLIGATVMLKNASDLSTAGTITDINGSFNLNLPADGTLVVTFIGYRKQEIPINGQTSFTINMQADVSELDDIVVVGFGVQKKETVVGSITQAKGEELLKTGGVTSVSEALTGLLPGVVTLQNSSQPGDASTDILIRGKSSWNGNAPLVLVDGIERPYDQVDPNEIQSLSVLKDASATAVFGVRGANGVILITTKRGTESKPKISFNANVTAKQMTSDYTIPTHAQSMQMYNEALINGNSYSGMYSEQEIAMWQNQVDPYFYPEIDWEKELLKDLGWSQTANLNVSGGNKFMKYFTSVGYTHEGDIFKTEKQAEYDPRFNFNKYNLRSNFDFSVTNTTKLSVNLGGIISKQTRPGGVGASANDYSKNEFFRRIYSTPNHLYPLYYENGQFGEDPSFQNAKNMYIRLNKEGSNIINQANVFVDFKLDQKLDFITKGLSFKGSVSYTNKAQSSRKINKTIDRYFYASSEDYENNVFLRWPTMDTYEEPISYANEEMGTYNRQLYYDASLNYNRDFGKHSVSALLLTLREETKSKVQFPDRYMSHVARATYAYNARYLLEFNGSISGINWFHPDYNTEDFYSGAIGWIISEENFIKDNLPFIDKMKVRYSWGESGSYDGFRSLKFNWDIQPETFNVNGNRILYFGDPVNPVNQFYVTSGASNKFAFWEIAIKQNIGVELDMFRKLSLTFDFYKEQREGILSEQLMPTWAGIDGKIISNLGESKTQGFELEATWRNKTRSGLNYWITGIFAYTENRVVKRGDPDGMPEYQKYAGKPIGTVNALLTDGFYGSWDDLYNRPQSEWSGNRIPGDLAYLDYNADGVINDRDRVPMKYQSTPNLTSSLQLGIEYKGFHLTAMLTATNGMYRNMPGTMLWEFQNGNTMTFNHSLNRWTPETAETAEHPALHLQGDNKHNMQTSQFTYRDASYIRLRNAEFGYTLPKKTAQKLLGMTKCELYLSGNNLLTFTDFDNRIDPEQGTTNLYPIVRRFNAGVRIGF